MSTVNPYVPPEADLVPTQTAGFQDVKYWSAKGRVGRLRYIAYAMGGYLILIVASFILGAGFGLIGQARYASAVGAITALPYMVFTIMLGIRRSHDMNWSGWMVLLTLIPFVGLIWLFKSGTDGANDYGAPPPPNTLGVKILAWLFPVLVLIGIAAAIAIPSFYANRVQAVQSR